MTDGRVDLALLDKMCSLSPSLLRMWVEAAVVMLDKFHRTPPPATPVSFTCDDDDCVLHVDWASPEVVAMESHANEKDATEDGAYALAVAAASHRGYQVRRRAHQGAGADLLMVRRGEPDNDFVKLEVSGVARGHALDERLAHKLEQVTGGDLNRPGVALVVGFEAATILARHR